jgi:hypothetical protein
MVGKCASPGIPEEASEQDPSRGSVASPAPEADTFRPGPWRVLLFLIPAAIILLGSIFLPGDVGVGLRAVGVTVSVLLLRLALLRHLFRVHLNPDGILISGEPGIPWSAVTAGRLLEPGGGNGFEIIYLNREGQERRVHVPRGLARYHEAWNMFLARTDRPGAP